MPEIRAGALVRANDRPPAVFEQDATGVANVSSTAYIAGTPEVSETFVAPTTGRVWVLVGGGLRDNSATGDRVWLAPEIRLGDASGAVVLAADSEARGIGSIQNHTEYHYYSRLTLVEGLTPGETYFARCMHKVVTGAGTCDISAREIGVTPG